MIYGTRRATAPCPASGRRATGERCWPLVLSAAVHAACGGASGAAPRAAESAAAPAAPTSGAREKGVSTSAEIGALDEREAEQSFRASLDGLQACVSSGVERFDFLSGEIELAVKIDSTRQARQVWASHSSLGERATEKCMFDALRGVSWPVPVGGAYGIARNSFEFAGRKGSPELAVWDAGRVTAAVEALAPAFGECGEAATSGGLLITLYIGEGGRALAGGAASQEPVAEEAVDCVVNALLAAEYPVPERSPTKVRFRL